MSNYSSRFIVQDALYSQHIGYPLWCGHVLQTVLNEPADNAENLVIQIAALMQDKGDPEYQNIYDRSCAILGLDPEKSDNEQIIFGPAFSSGFGRLGGCTVTAIGSLKPKTVALNDSGYRGYRGVIDKNLGTWLQYGCVTPMSFSYPIPGENRNLQLMKLGKGKDLFPEEYIAYHMVGHFGDFDSIEEAIFFRHPSMRTSYPDFVRCLQPLYEPGKDMSMDDIITAYWVDAQATPVQRGGSAHSMILLQVLAACAGTKLPHIKPGTDLWAEAATTHLDEYIDRFKQDQYFDRNLRDEDITNWQSRKLGIGGAARSI